jgi:hypothetical protein
MPEQTDPITRTPVSEMSPATSPMTGMTGPVPGEKAGVVSISQHVIERLIDEAIDGQHEDEDLEPEEDDYEDRRASYEIEIKCSFTDAKQVHFVLEMQGLLARYNFQKGAHVTIE